MNVISTHYPKYLQSSASALIESHLGCNRVGSLLYNVGDKVYHLASFFLRPNHLWTILMRLELDGVLYYDVLLYQVPLLLEHQF